MQRRLKHLCEITTSPLWQRRPLGILVHSSVAGLRRNDGEKPARTRTRNNVGPYFLGSGGFRDSSPSTSLAESPVSQLRVRLSLPLSLSHRAAKMRLGITCGGLNARVVHPAAPAQLRIHASDADRLVTVVCAALQRKLNAPERVPRHLLFPDGWIYVHCGPPCARGDSRRFTPAHKWNLWSQFTPVTCANVRVGSNFRGWMTFRDHAWVDLHDSLCIINELPAALRTLSAHTLYICGLSLVYYLATFPEALAWAAARSDQVHLIFHAAIVPAERSRCPPPPRCKLTPLTSRAACQPQQHVIGTICAYMEEHADNPTLVFYFEGFVNCRSNPAVLGVCWSCSPQLLSLVSLPRSVVWFGDNKWMCSATSHFTIQQRHLYSECLATRRLSIPVLNGWAVIH